MDGLDIERLVDNPLNHEEKCTLMINKKTLLYTHTYDPSSQEKYFNIL